MAKKVIKAKDEKKVKELTEDKSEAKTRSNSERRKAMYGSE